MDFGFDRIHNK
jgi:hypothetical protein